jgi:hypothetical protein
VRDDSTGHEYDVQERAVRAGMTVLPDRGKHVGLRPRPTKHYTTLDGRPARYRQAPAPVVTDLPTPAEPDADEPATNSKEGRR